MVCPTNAPINLMPDSDPSNMLITTPTTTHTKQTINNRPRPPHGKKKRSTTTQKNRRCFREETFGPLIPIFRFSTEDEAVALANDTEYGLAAYFYTRDLARAWRIAERLEYGMVGLNEIGIGSEVAPFGGVKQSGYGVENSARGLEDYLVVKYVCMGLGGE
jgi:acyl-CoA reductase-like NAD-dependent aldehyde dehydrogenase